MHIGVQLGVRKLKTDDIEKSVFDRIFIVLFLFVFLLFFYDVLMLLLFSCTDSSIDSYIKAKELRPTMRIL